MSNWRKNGVHRLTMELPEPTWKKIQAEAERLGVEPVHVIRIWLSERAGPTQEEQKENP